MSKEHLASRVSAYPSRHPLQRLPSPTLQGLSPLLHFLQLSAHLASFRYLSTNPTPINDSYGWHFQYLTIFGLALSTLTALLGSLSDLLSPFNSPPDSSSQLLFSAQKSLLFGVAAPLEILVSTLYWSLRLIDKDLVVPEWAQLPLLPDLSFHILPTVCLLLDAFLLSPPPRQTPRHALLTSTLIAAAYYPWVQLCHFKNGYYPYPIFELVGFYGRIGLFALSAVAMAGNAGLVRLAYAALNGVEDQGPAVGGGGEPKGGGQTKSKPVRKVGKKEAVEVVMGESVTAGDGEPEALKRLRDSVSGTLRRRTELVEKEG